MNIRTSETQEKSAGESLRSKKVIVPVQLLNLLMTKQRSREKMNCLMTKKQPDKEEPNNNNVKQ